MPVKAVKALPPELTVFLVIDDRVTFLHRQCRQPGPIRSGRMARWRQRLRSRLFVPHSTHGHTDHQLSRSRCSVGHNGSGRAVPENAGQITDHVKRFLTVGANTCAGASEIYGRSAARSFQRDLQHQGFSRDHCITCRSKSVWMPTPKNDIRCRHTADLVDGLQFAFDLPTRATSTSPAGLLRSS